MRNFIFIGTLPQIDTDESNRSGEDPDVILGTYHNSVLQTVAVSAVDTDGNGYINDDDRGATVDPVTYDLGAGFVDTVTDHSAMYNATMTLGDGTTRVIDVVVVQMANGDTFVSDPVSSSDLDNLQIQSIELIEAGQNNYAGWLNDRSFENASIVCFAKETLIATPQGKRPVERLRCGDLVTTADKGVMPILWIGHKSVEVSEKTRPVEICKGALGQGIPSRNLFVSRQHRILLGSPITRRMYGCDHIFVPAIHLVGWPGIRLRPQGGSVDYYHILLDGHQVIHAEDAPAESLFPGAEAIKGMPMLSRIEMMDLNATLSEPIPDWQLAYPILQPKLRQSYFRRHRKNGVPLVDTTGTASSEDATEPQTRQIPDIPQATYPRMTGNQSSRNFWPATMSCPGNGGEVGPGRST